MWFRDLSSYILDEAVFVPGLDARDYVAALRAVVKALHAHELCHDKAEQRVNEFIAAERDLSFLLGGNVAMPHLYIPREGATKCGWLRSESGVRFGKEKMEVNLIFCAVGNTLHLPAVMAVAYEIVKSPGFIHDVQQKAITNERFLCIVRSAFEAIIEKRRAGADIGTQQYGGYVYEECTISNRRGLHARAAAKLGKILAGFDCEMRVARVYDNMEAVDRSHFGEHLYDKRNVWKRLPEPLAGWNIFVTQLTQEVWVEQCDGRVFVSVEGLDILGLMVLGAGPGTKMYLRASGNQAREGVEIIKALIEARFEED